MFLRADSICLCGRWTRAPGFRFSAKDERNARFWQFLCGSSLLRQKNVHVLYTMILTFQSANQLDMTLLQPLKIWGNVLNCPKKKLYGLLKYIIVERLGKQDSIHPA